ncbi:MAG TPA: transcription antitermination factor NusB [Chloroflexi bacterium]|nr:transcription antitermination factor NusB [Chloroflexota bacterium]
MKGERRRARELALQALYEIDLVGHEPGQVLQERFLDDPELSKAVQHYSSRLVQGVVQSRALLDEHIQAHAREWPLEQVAVIDRNLLRLSLYEMAMLDVPVRVVINEAVELAKSFGADNAPRFVNGVLGALAPLRREIARALAPVLPSER